MDDQKANRAAARLLKVSRSFGRSPADVFIPVLDRQTFRTNERVAANGLD